MLTDYFKCLKPNKKETITITIGDVAENHVGMQKIGKLANCGFNKDDLVNIKMNFEKLGVTCELININNLLPTDIRSNLGAYILVIRKGVDYILKESGKRADDMLLEQQSIKIEWDKKSLMYKKVVNKKARYNLCYGPESQEPDYKNGRGRVVSFDEVPCLKYMIENLHIYLGEKGRNLIAEGNRYYDIRSCYIGWHGDTERRKVIGVRLGASFPLYYQWYYKGSSVGDKLELSLNHGDFYIMSEKASGFDWKLRNTYTLRHAAGFNVK